MDHDNAGGAVSGGCVGCSHNSCDFDLILPLTFEEWYVLHYDSTTTCAYLIVFIIAH